MDHHNWVQFVDVFLDLVLFLTRHSLDGELNRIHTVWRERTSAYWYQRVMETTGPIKPFIEHVFEFQAHKLT